MNAMARAAAVTPALLVAGALLLAGVTYAWALLGELNDPALGHSACSRGAACADWAALGLAATISLVGAVGAWGVATRTSRALLFGALAFSLLWLVYSAWLLTRQPERMGAELAATVRQHGAMLVLVGAAYLGGALSLGWRPSGSQRSAIAAIAGLVAAIGAAGFLWGAPFRHVPGTGLPLGLALLAAAAATAGTHRRSPALFCVAAALLVTAALHGALLHLRFDPEPLVAVFSYGGPAGLALAPAALLLLLEAGRLRSAAA